MTARKALPVHAGRPATLIGLLALISGLLSLGATSLSGASTVAPPEHTAWVATDASVTLPGASLTPVNLSTDKVETRVHVGSLPSAMAFTAGDKELLVVSQGTDTLHAINPNTHGVIHSARTGVEPDAIAVAPGGTHGRGIALVANLDSNTVTPIDLGTWKAGPPIAVGTEPVAIGIARSSGGTTALVVNFGSDDVTPIDLSTMQASAPIAVGASPQTIAMLPTEALVGNFGDHTLTPISTSSLQPGAAVALPVDPTAMALASSGSTLYIAGGASVVPVSVAGLVVGTPIALPGVAQGIALAAGGTTAWVALQAGALVPVMLSTSTAGRPIRLAGHPSAVVIATR
jgi:YVTN family beta-propeller protein